MLTFLLGALISIPLSIFANLWTPKVKDYLARRSSVKGKKRIDALTAELIETRKYLSDKPLFVIFLIRRTFTILLGLTTVVLSIVAVVVYQFSYLSGVPMGRILVQMPVFLSIATVFLTVQALTSSVRLANRVLNFEKYESSMRRRFLKLGGSMPTEEVESTLITSDSGESVDLRVEEKGHS